MDEQTLELGKLISSVETLTQEVNSLRTEVADLKAKANTGKGIFYGALFAAGSAGAGASHVLDAIFGR